MLVIPLNINGVSFLSVNNSNLLGNYSNYKNSSRSSIDLISFLNVGINFFAKSFIAFAFAYP